MVPAARRSRGPARSAAARRVIRGILALECPLSGSTLTSPSLIEGPCHHCGSTDVCGRHQGRTHQSFELPDLRALITEWQLESGRCGGCRRRRSAKRPAEMPRGCRGPEALVATLTGTFQLSRRDAERFLSEVMRIEISLGTVSSTEKIVSEALNEDPSTALRQQAVAGVDETGHKRAGAQHNVGRHVATARSLPHGRAAGPRGVSPAGYRPALRETTGPLGTRCR